MKAIRYNVMCMCLHCYIRTDMVSVGYFGVHDLD